MTVESTPAAAFETTVTGIRTATVGELAGVITQVDWVIKAVQGSQSFDLPQTTELSTPNAANFVPLSAITDPDLIVRWIEAAEPRLPSIKAHIQMVLDRLVKEAASEPIPLPWATAVDTAIPQPPHEPA